MKRLLAYLFIVLGLGLVVSVNAKAEIVIPTHNWSSQVVGSYVIGGIFEEMGHRVKYVPADSQAVYEQIRKGKVSISHEVWESAFGRSFDRARDKGGIIDAGSHVARTHEDMGVPNWVIEKNLCPGLPDWTALKNPSCARNFARHSGGKGIWLEGPKNWHQDLMPQRLHALGLGNLWKVEFAGGADALWAELARAKREGRGTIMFNWTPNFTDMEGFTMIEFPPYYAGCRPVDGGDGRCGSPTGYLKKAASSKFAKNYPDAFRAFQKINFTTLDIGTMAALVSVDKMTPEAAAKRWLRDNRHKWKYWIGRSNVVYDAVKQQRIDQKYPTTQIAKKEPTIKPKKKVVEVAKTTQEIFKPKKKDLDNDPPVIEIAEAITVVTQSYTIKGTVRDKSKPIYLEINGRPVEVKNGKFELDRFNIDPDVVEELKIVAIDQWNNRSEKIVKVTVELQSTEVVRTYEELKPNKVKVLEDKNKIAIIIGIEKYIYLTNLDAPFANRDAKAFKAYATRALGVKSSNIKLLVDDKAARPQILEAFKLWLPRIAADGEKDIYIFFSGHGLASDDGNDLYILPQNGNSLLLEDTAITRVKLISLIQKVNPKSVTMFFDTCYSGQTREERMLIAGLKPIRIVAGKQDTPDNFTIFSASNFDQTSGTIKEAKQGMFSYYLMKGLEGKADTDKDYKITNGELIAYLKTNVSKEAFTQNRQQDPMLSGDPNKILMSYR